MKRVGPLDYFTGLMTSEDRIHLSSQVSRYIRKARNAVWEVRLNIHTRGRFKHGLDPDSHSYVGCAYTVIWLILDRLKMTERDIFVDIGCGKGRVLCCAAQHHIRKTVGVEINPELCSAARNNVRRLRRAKAPVEIVEAQAQEADYSEGTLFFIFNSFGPKTMEMVQERIRNTLSGNPRDIKLVYVNDRSGFHVLQDSGWLELIERWVPDQWSQLDNPVSFWRSITIK